MVFDGTPPKLKVEYALAKRKGKHDKSLEDLEVARQQGDAKRIAQCELQLIKPNSNI